MLPSLHPVSSPRSYLANDLQLNSAITCRSPNDLQLNSILREKGYGASKSQVCRGKPPNQSVLSVKFSPTLSVLQEAERHHKHYADNNRGRLGFQQITYNSGDFDKDRDQVEKNEDVLYGYMAIAKDLDKLDLQTKKRSFVRSKTDTVAIANAPLNMD